LVSIVACAGCRSANAPPHSGAERSPSGTSQRVGGLFFDPQGADFTRWVNHFKNEVHRNWIVNEPALVGFKGHVAFEFTVEKDGSMTGLRVLRSSGTPMPDRAAQNAVIGSSFLPLPDGYRQPRITMQVTFSYNENPVSGGNVVPISPTPLAKSTITIDNESGQTGAPVWYLEGLANKIRTIWLANEHPRGKVAPVVGFTIRADGSVAEVVLVETSGVAELDLAARRAVLSASQFAPLPRAVGQAQLKVRAVFKSDR